MASYPMPAALRTDWELVTPSDAKRYWKIEPKGKSGKILPFVQAA
jgi:hypothetical protein